jgi:stage II sporulation protein D
VKRGALLLLIAAGALHADVRVLLLQKELPNAVEIPSPLVVEIDGREGRRAERLSLQSTAAGVSWTDGVARGVAKKLVLRPVGGALRVRTPRGFEADYEGRLTVDRAAGRLRLVNTLGEEPLLFSVTAQEVPSDWPTEAIKAQLVVGRTFLARNRGRHWRDEADYCDLAHCQVYRGRGARGNVERAAPDTAGLVLTGDGRPAEVFFHADCGGHTAWAEDVWPAGGAGSRGVRDEDGGREYCDKAPHHLWRTEIRADELARLIDGKGAKDRGLRVATRDRSGRAKQLRWGTRVLRGEDLYLRWGRRRGWHELKSTRFNLKRAGDRYVFVGRGLGHGVGLCQHGAAGRARAGFGFREILAAYFPGLALTAETPPPAPGGSNR